MPSEFTPEAPAIPRSRGKLEPRPRPLTEAERRLLRCEIRQYERRPGELERDEAESFDVEAVGYAEFEEAADEGACHAFDLGDGRLAFLVGQQFYPSARFPSLDFSVVYPLDESGRSADMWIEKRGEAVPPDRVIPADVKWELFEEWFPELLDVVQGDLEGLEAALRRVGS